jgi:hypothetical protein
MTSAVIVNLETAEVVVEDVDEAELAIKRAAWEATRPERERQASNAVIISQITKIETERQPRAIREVALGLEGSVARLQAINAEIAALRSQLS